MYVLAPHACLMLVESEEGDRFPGAEVIDGCELPAMWVVGTKLKSSGRVASALESQLYLYILIY